MKRTSTPKMYESKTLRKTLHRVATLSGFRFFDPHPPPAHPPVNCMYRDPADHGKCATIIVPL